LEFVYVVRRSDLFDGQAAPHGFVPAGEAPDWRRRFLERGFFVERAVAEEEPAWKQVIPYNVVIHEDRVVLLRRGGRIQEARLRARLSIGVGGHVNPPDADGAGGRPALLDVASAREVREEIVTRGSHRVETLGYVNDDSNAVGSVHFGVVHAVRLDHPEVRVREADNLEGGLVAWEALRERFQEDRAQFETWSALLLESWLETGPPLAMTSPHDGDEDAAGSMGS